MMRGRTVGVLTALAAVVALAGGVAFAVGRADDDTPAERQAERAFTAAHEDQAAVDRSEAEAAALEAHPGTVIESELESDGDGLIWEIEIDQGSAIREVTVDAQNGRVLGAEVEGTEGAEGNEDG